MRKTDKLIIAAFVGVSIVCVAAGLYWRNSRVPTGMRYENLNVGEVLAAGQRDKTFQQISFYYISSFDKGIATGAGHVRYNGDGNMIYVFGRGTAGAMLEVTFEDTQSNAYKLCQELAKSEVPVRQELFIAGRGTSDINSLDIGQAAARIKLQAIDQCGFVRKLE